VVSGTLNNGGLSVPIEGGRLRGDQIQFTAGGVQYAARVNGDAMKGEAKGSSKKVWTATRARP
jgi:hypothetical protein